MVPCLLTEDEIGATLFVSTNEPKSLKLEDERQHHHDTHQHASTILDRMNIQPKPKIM